MKSIAQAFDKAAINYAVHNQVQQRVGRDLLDWVNLAAPSQILDLGCGSGQFTRCLVDAWPQAHITALDIAPAMLAQTQLLLADCAQVQCLCQDMHSFNQANRYDAIVSNFALQWSQDLPELLNRLHAALRPSGSLCFSVPVAGSLIELQQAWSCVDDFCHVNTFFSIQEWLLILKQVFRSENQVYMHRYRILPYVEYRSNLRDLLRLFRGWGADYLQPPRRKSLLGKAAWQRLEQAYQVFRTEQGYPLTFQVAFFQVQKCGL